MESWFTGIYYIVGGCEIPFFNDVKKGINNQFLEWFWLALPGRQGKNDDNWSPAEGQNSLSGEDFFLRRRAEIILIQEFSLLLPTGNEWYAYNIRMF